MAINARPNVVRLYSLANSLIGPKIAKDKSRIYLPVPLRSKTNY